MCSLLPEIGAALKFIRSYIQYSSAVHSIPLMWCFRVMLSREMGLAPGVFGRFDLAALVKPHRSEFVFVCLFVLYHHSSFALCKAMPDGC